MYLQALLRLNKYLSSLVVKKDQCMQASQKEKLDQKSNAVKRDALYIEDENGLLFKITGNKAELVDGGGIFDPLERRVEGDHYATSHFILMSVILFVLTQDKKYLDKALYSLDFCLFSLNGYPRVPWDMHFDFNNYALATAFCLVENKIGSQIRNTWLKKMALASMNRHRVTNWSGQRLVYLSFLKKYAPVGSGLKRSIYFLNKFHFLYGYSSDGAFEDHKGKSRPIQYHVFSLALAILLEIFNTGVLNKDRLYKALAHFLYFVAPDGDFNYFGRGHRQIFAYSPALFLIEAVSKDYPELKKYSDGIWKHVADYQHEDGSFPLVLSDYPDVQRIGWYDYHRLSVYNAFFGAWLALAQLAKENRPEIKLRSFQTKPNSPTNNYASSAIFTCKKSAYFICLSKGFRLYPSECALSPHKLYFDGIGTIMSCPGGPEPNHHGFGKRFIFKNAAMNYFAPICKTASEVWYNPGKMEAGFKLGNNSLSYDVGYGPIKIVRRYFFLENAIEVEDLVEVKDQMNLTEVRIINVPINMKDKSVKIEPGIIKLFSNNGNSLKIEIQTQTTLSDIESLDSYDWVDGRVTIFGIKTFPISNPNRVYYRFSMLDI